MGARRNKKKLGLTIPIDPKSRGFDDPSSSSLSPSSQSSSLPPLSPSSTTNKSSYYSAFFSPRLLPPSYTVPQIEALDKEKLAKTNKPQRLSKQLSMSDTVARDMSWERRCRRRHSNQCRGKRTSAESDDVRNLTDEDLCDLKGCIELGFGFREENGQKLCNTLPALDLYFAVNRQLSSSTSNVKSLGSPITSPPQESKEISSSLSSPDHTGLGLEKRSASLDSHRADGMRNIFGSGDNPQQIKTKLRHWAQAVACSVMQYPNHPNKENDRRKSLS